jgi:hypothetical protein
MIRSLAFAPLLALAACGTPEAQNAQAPTRAAPGTNYVEELRTMNEGQRNATLFRAIQDAGRECQQVVRSAEAQAVSGSAAWTATCETGVTWVVAVGETGNATVTNARELEAAGVQ